MSSEVPIETDCRTVRDDLAASQDLLLIDCREPDEHRVAAIAQARLFPMSEIESRVKEMEPHRDRRVVVHCHHGGRSLKVARWLREQGFSKAQSMAGGIDEWSREIDPAVPRY
jgi:rhodanese-related sulfurtransferase